MGPGAFGRFGNCSIVVTLVIWEGTAGDIAVFRLRIWG